MGQFCKLSDVNNNAKKNANLSNILGISTTGTAEESSSKKISLKVMTLNNSRQKINDCLGNPIEIGIAVTWRVVDTAKAAFNVDNYKEYLSLLRIKCPMQVLKLLKQESLILLTPLKLPRLCFNVSKPLQSSMQEKFF